MERITEYKVQHVPHTCSTGRHRYNIHQACLRNCDFSWLFRTTLRWINYLIPNRSWISKRISFWTGRVFKCDVSFVKEGIGGNWYVVLIFYCTGDERVPKGAICILIVFFICHVLFERTRNHNFNFKSLSLIFFPTLSQLFVHIRFF